MPWPADSMRVVGPVTKSPHAKTPRTFVAYVPGSTRMRPRRISNDDSTGRNVLSAAWLTAGMTVWAGTTNSAPSMGTGRAPPRGIGLTEAVADEAHAGDVALAVSDDLDRADEELHAHALALRLAELLLVDDELGTGAPVRDRHVLRAVAEAGARAVHRRVAAADDDDVPPDLDRLAEVGRLHEVDAVLDAGEVVARHVQRHGVHRAGADGDRVEPLLELLERDVSPDARVVAEGHAEPLDQARVHLDGLAREAEGRARR